MALPPLHPSTNNIDIPFLRNDGVVNPDQTIVEPGVFFDTTLNDVGTANYPQVVQVSDYELTGTFASSALWTVTVTPLTTQSGTAAAAHAMAPASATFQAAASAASAVVTGLIAAVNAAALTVAAAMTGSNIATFVEASVGAAANKLRLTARTPGMTFSVSISSSLAGDSATETVISSPVTSTVKVGLYYALDTTKGTAGYDKMGRPYLTKITASTNPANIIGPIYRGADTQPVARGFAFREYIAGQNIPFVRYGHISAYGEKAIPLSNGPEVVYVRHTDAGDFLAGMATDLAGASSGATANVWTGTPTPANDTVYTVSIAYGNEVVLLTHLSDGTATATEICDGLRAELAKVNGAGKALEGITGSGTTTLVLTGPADGRGFTPAQAGAGVIGFVETTPEVSTHIRLTRGDKFIASSTRIGPSRVAVPLTPNV